MDWIVGNIIRPIFFSIDSIIYGLISILYELLMYLANINIFGNDSGVAAIKEFTERIYMLLGIFMLFKVSFSILRYLVDPDSFSDKSKGMGKLITNVLIVVALLAFTPTIFKMAFDIQGKILESNALAELILGNSAGSSTVDEDGFGGSTGGSFGDSDSGNTKKSVNNTTIAKDIQFLVFGSFFTVNYNMEELNTCKDGPVLGTKAMARASDGKCIDQVNDILVNKSTAAKIEHFFRYENGGEIVDKRSFSSFQYLLNLSKNDEYYFNYQFIVSTIAGAFIVVMLLTYCIDVAVRIIKLFFLQIIAPIPIVSYIDPNQGKDGIMMKWAKECGKTYLSLFIRLALIYLAFYLIDLVATITLATTNSGLSYYNNDVPSGGMSVLVVVMIILGILIFVNQAPKLIEEIFGLKSTGEYSFNPLKKIKESPLATGALAGTVGLAVGAPLGALNAYNASKGMGRSPVRSIVSGLGGVFSGAARGVKGGIQGKDKTFGLKSAVGSMGAIADSMRMRKEAGVLGQAGATINEITGSPYEVDLMDEQINKREQYISHINSAKELAEKYADDQAAVKDIKRQLEAAKQVGDANAVKQLEADLKNKRDSEIETYINKGTYDSATGQWKKDQKIEAYLNAAQRIYSENSNIDGLQSIVNDQGNIEWKKAKEGKEKANNANVVTKVSDAYENAKAKKEISQKSAKNSWIRNQ